MASGDPHPSFAGPLPIGTRIQQGEGFPKHFLKRNEGSLQASQVTNPPPGHTNRILCRGAARRVGMGLCLGHQRYNEPMSNLAKGVTPEGRVDTWKKLWATPRRLDDAAMEA